MSKVKFQSVRICDSQSSHHGQVTDVWVEGGQVVQVGGERSDEGFEVCEGGWLSPGWMDLRVHLTDPGHEYKENLKSLAEAARHGGFVSVLAMPNTHPVPDNSGAIQSLRTRAADLPIELLPTGTLSEGGKGKDLAELYDMGQAGAVAFTDGIHPVDTAGLLLRGLQYLKPLDGLLIDFPMDADLVKGAEVAEGVVSTRMGLKGIPELVETLAIERNLQLLAYFPGRLHLGPITTESGINRLKGLKSRFPDLSLETSALYLLADDERMEDFDPNFKVWPPLRNRRSVESLRRAVMEGVIDVVSSSHHPQSLEEKKHDFVTAQCGAAMIETAFSAAWTGLAQAGGSVETLVHTLTYGPARVLRREIPGIKTGARASVTWFDPETDWTPQASEMKSRARNHALVGEPLKGKVLGTYAKGQFLRN